MKRITFSILFILLAITLFFTVRPASETDTATANEPTAKENPVSPAQPQPETQAKPSINRVVAGVDDQGKLIQPAQEKVTAKAAPKPDPFIKKVITEQWLDKNPSKAGRRRIRIVEADFKYPHIRLEEEVWTDPKTGKETVKRIRASVADHIMLGLKPDTDEKAARKLLEQNGYRIRAIEPGSYILAELTEYKAADAQQKSITDIEALNEFIDYAEPDYLVYPTVTPNDPAFASRKMWGLDNPGLVAGTTADADIDAPEAWDLRHDASNVIVAVTDTGIQYNHEDLAPNMWQKNGNGEYGYDAYDDDFDPMDTGGHGTHCAGTIGARGNNGIGLTGVAWNVQLMGGRFLGPNGGTSSDGIKVINYARINGAHIISASWGGGGYSQGVYNAIKAAGDAGIPFIAAAGNDSLNNDATPHYPSSYDLPTIVSVASTTSQDKLSYFSCYGRYSVDIAAPGSDIWSCYIGSNSSYKHLNGTSMATPHVSGALALAKAEFPTEDAEDLIARLYSSVDHIPALAGKVSTGGRLNVQKLLGASTAGVNNDDFENALRFDGEYGYWSGSNKKATRETDEDNFSFPGTGTRSVWFAWKAPYQGLVEFHVEADANPLRVIGFKGSDKQNLVLAAEGTGLGNGTNRTVRFYCQADQEYRILIDSSHPTGQNLLATLSLKPVNDAFTSALGLTGDRFTAKGSNRNATLETFEQTAPHGGVGKGKSVWWKWTPDFDGEFVLTTQGSEFDTVLAVYTGSNQNTLTEVASNDDRNALDWTSQVTFPVTSGTTYYIAVDGYRGDGAGGILLNGFTKGVLAIISQPTGSKVRVGERVVFDVGVIAGGSVNYQWKLNGVDIPGETRATLVIPSVESEDYGSYNVLVYNEVDQVISNVAELTEALSPPTIYWHSGDKTVESGTTVNLLVQVRGSAPLSYTWYKDDVLLPQQNTRQLALLGVQPVDSGKYRVDVVNGQGTDSQEFNLGVVASPWDGWEWRRPGVPNSKITDMQVFGNEVYAVAGNTLLRSTDAENWHKSPLPNGFQGASVAKLNGKLIVLGKDRSNTRMVAVSVNSGVSWSLHLLTGVSSSNLPDFAISVFNNLLVSSFGGAVHYSADGVSWQTCMVTTKGGQTYQLNLSGRISTDGSIMLGTGNTDTSILGLSYFKTTDGINWLETDTQVGPENGASNGYAKSSAYQQGKFYLFSTYAVYTSQDGLNWNYHLAPSNGISTKDIAVSNSPDEISFFQKDSQYIKWLSTPETSESRLIAPANSQNFTAAVSFMGKLVYATERGIIGAVTDLNEVVFPDIPLSGLKSIDFVNGQFVVTPEGSAPPLKSGDGVTWEPISTNNHFSVDYSGFAGGIYWGVKDNATVVARAFGYYLDENYELPNSPPSPVRSACESPDGVQIVLAASDVGSTAMSIYRKADANAQWQKVSAPITIYSGQKITHIGDKWFLQGYVSGVYTIFVSADGLSWQDSGITHSHMAITDDNGEFVAVYGSPTYPYRSRVVKSSDGVAWTEVAATGLPEVYNAEVRNLVAFNQSLVVQIGSSVYYSNNGQTWAIANLPTDVVDIAGGAGQLVVALEDGGLLQTGNPSAGGNAPWVSIQSPMPSSKHLIGSKVNVRGGVEDPEEGAVSYTAYVDNQLVSSGTGLSFEFDFVATSYYGHTVVVRAMDSSGLVSEDSLVVYGASLEPENLLDEGEGELFVPKKFATQLRGAFYVAGNRSLYRSVNGVDWERVPLPSMDNSIYAMASGNGSLVLQFQDGTITSTRDGINWVQFKPNETDYWLQIPIRFESGRFVAAYQEQGTVTGSVMSSIDGFEWKTGIVSADGFLGWQAINPDDVIIGAAGYQFGVRRSIDKGKTWFLLDVAGLQNVDYSSSGGLFADGQFAVVNSISGKIYSSPNGYDWTESSHPAGANSGMSKIWHIGGRYFLGNSNTLFYSSNDRVTWNQMSQSVSPDGLSFGQGVYVGSSPNGLVVSSDGVEWSVSLDRLLLNSPQQIMANHEGFIAIGSNGEVWNATNGVNWEKILAGQNSSVFSSSSKPRDMAILGNRMILAGSYNQFAYSDDEGETWKACQVTDGNQVVSTSHLQSVITSGTAAIALPSNWQGTSVMYRSEDGIHWTVLDEFNGHLIVDVNTNGSEWMAVCNDGQILRSIDDGITWTEVVSDVLKRGATVVWFGSKWVIIGSIETGFNKPFHYLTLGAGDVVTDHGSAGFQNSSSTVFSLVAHGKLIVWERGELIRLTSDGITWSVASFGPGLANHEYDVYYDEDGFVAFIGSGSSSFPLTTWRSGPDALEWDLVPSFFYAVEKARNVGDRVFVFGGDKMFELFSADLALSILPNSEVTLGVGDELSVGIQINNLGAKNFVSNNCRVEAWLSKDDFYGDDNDSYLGSHHIESIDLNSGEHGDYVMKFEIPQNVITGGNHVILKLVRGDSTGESNLANNYDISASKFVNIPEWELNLNAVGSGQINQNIAGRKYPHGARISLTANAGKGAAFAGWGGDALGAESQITILMDGNKSVQANFSSRTSLQVHVRGNGSVDGLADLGSYGVGDTASLTAAPATDWVFSGWSGAATGNSATANITMDANKVVTAVFTLPMNTWRSNNFTAAELEDSAISGDDADPDGDGLKNWQEYLHMSDPKDGAARGIVSSKLEGGFLYIIFTRNGGAASGLSLGCQGSRDLSDWDAPDIQERILSTQDGIETVEARIPAGGNNKGFLRLSYSRP